MREVFHQQFSVSVAFSVVFNDRIIFCCSECQCTSRHHNSGRNGCEANRVRWVDRGCWVNYEIIVYSSRYYGTISDNRENWAKSIGYAGLVGYSGRLLNRLMLPPASNHRRNGVRPWLHPPRRGILANSLPKTLSCWICVTFCISLGDWVYSSGGPEAVDHLLRPKSVLSFPIAVHVELSIRISFQ